MSAIDTHRNVILRKVSAFTLSCSLFLFSAHSDALDLEFKKVSDSEYKVTGSITGIELQWYEGGDKSDPLHIRTKIPDGRKFGYDGGSKYCNTNYADDAASIINQQLASGISLQPGYGSGGAVNDWATIITCYSPSRGGTWTTAYSSETPNPPPPTPPSCSISVPQTVEFSTLKPGKNPSVYQKSDVTLTCDKAASGNIDILGTQNGVLDIADAKVNVAFDDNQAKFSFKNSNLASTTLVVTVQDAGSTSGEKKGSVVLRATWD